MKFSYYVKQTYSDKGNVTTEILTAEQAQEAGYEDGHFEDLPHYDLYVDGKNTFEEAEAFAKEAREA